VSTELGLKFVTYLTAFASNVDSEGNGILGTPFDKNYTVLGRVHWYSEYNGTNVNGSWQDDGSSKIRITDASIDTEGCPEPGSEAHLNPRAPTYSQTPMVITPPGTWPPGQ
jgi:hypothetical protein